MILGDLDDGGDQFNGLIDAGERTPRGFFCDAEQVDVSLTDQVAEVGQTRDRVGQNVEDRLERLGDALDVAENRADELAQERAELERDVVVGDARGSVGKRPVDVQVGGDARKLEGPIGRRGETGLGAQPKIEGARGGDVRRLRRGQTDAVDVEFGVQSRGLPVGQIRLQQTERRRRGEVPKGGTVRRRRGGGVEDELVRRLRAAKVREPGVRVHEQFGSVEAEPEGVVVGEGGVDAPCGLRADLERKTGQGEVHVDRQRGVRDVVEAQLDLDRVRAAWVRDQNVARGQPQGARYAADHCLIGGLGLVLQFALESLHQLTGDDLELVTQDAAAILRQERNFGGGGVESSRF